MPLEAYAQRFVELLIVPFHNMDTMWGILPVYTSLVLGEIYERKISFGMAVCNGFVMLWAGLDWARHLSQVSIFGFKVLPWIVTACCIGLGVFTVVLGLRRKDKFLAEILGHTRFSSYFIILLYPMQAGLVKWTTTSTVAVLMFAVPAWLVLYGLGRLLNRLMK